MTPTNLSNAELVCAGLLGAAGDDKLGAVFFRTVTQHVTVEMPRVCCNTQHVRAGLLDVVRRDEDKLAAILGREAAHVVARHCAEGIGLSLTILGLGLLGVKVLQNRCLASLQPAQCAPFPLARAQHNADSMQETADRVTHNLKS